MGESSPRKAYEVIAALLDRPRFWPSIHLDEPIADSVRDEAFVALARLRQGAPFAYAVGRAAFRHLTMEVDEHVLIPRPETEILVEELLRLVQQGEGNESGRGDESGLPAKRGVAIDIGTGSEVNFSRVIATDLSLKALEVARRNASSLAGALNSPVEFRHGSLLQPVCDVTAEVIVSNPPYIAFSEVQELPASVRNWEPAMALLSGNDGMAATAEIVRGAAELLQSGGVLALEVDSRRASLVAGLLLVDPRYEDVAVRLDLTGRERFVVARRRGMQ
jgi:release factor glutamine methyltransferase